MLAYLLRNSLFLMVPITLLSAAAGAQISVKDYERAAVEKIRREKAASAKAEEERLAAAAKVEADRRAAAAKAEAEQRAAYARAQAVQRAAQARAEAELRAAEAKEAAAEESLRAEVARAEAERERRVSMERAAIAREIEVLEISANEGDVVSAMSLAQRYETGVRAEKSLELAVRWLKFAADLGNAQAQLKLAKYIEAGDVPGLGVQDGVKYLTDAAFGGDPVAKFLLAERYYHGNGLVQDKKKSIVLYEDAANLGSKDASARLAEEYQLGTFLKKDFSKANYFIGLSTNRFSVENDPLLKTFRGSYLGLYLSGNAHEKGLGVKRDTFKAFNTFKALSRIGFRDSSERSQKNDPFYYPGKSDVYDSAESLSMYCGSDYIYFDRGVFNYDIVQTSRYLKEQGRNTFHVKGILYNRIYDFDAKKAYYLGSVTLCN